jgi:hypothetical protein
MRAVLIPAVEQGLERMLRAALPLPEDVGDVSFEAPTGTWGAQLSRVTVNLFLFDVSRSAQPPRPAAERPGADGRLERRAPLPMVQLNYLVSAWAGNTRDEHQLLGDVLACLLQQQVLPPEHLTDPLPSSVQLALGQHESHRTRDIWAAIDGRFTPSFELVVTVALDTLAWEPTAPRVERIEGLTAPIPSPRPTAKG